MCSEICCFVIYVAKPLVLIVWRVEIQWVGFQLKSRKTIIIEEGLRFFDVFRDFQSKPPHFRSVTLLAINIFSGSKGEILTRLYSRHHVHRHQLGDVGLVV